MKVIGRSLADIEVAAREIERVLRKVPGTASAFSERIGGGYYLTIEPDRRELARYGLSVDQVQDTIAMALGRRGGDDDRRGPRALRRQHPLSARSAQRSANDRAAGDRADGGRRRRAARPSGAHQVGTRAIDHPHGGRAARGLCVRRRARPRSGRLCRRGARRRCARGEVSGRRLSDLERTVRVSGTGAGEADGRGAVHAADHLPAALSEFRAFDARR